MIPLKTPEQIEIMRHASQIVHCVLDVLANTAVAGMTTAELDQLAEDVVAEHGARSAFKGYRGYPACICASLNEAVVHGIPDDRVLIDGDILSIDMGVIIDGYYGDAAITIGIGEVSAEKQKLMKVTRQSLYEGIAQAVCGNRLSDISHAIQTYVEAHGFSVVRHFVGHGIGKVMHEEPQIPNFGAPHKGPVLKPGMVLAIEPMVNMGSPDVYVDDDGWTARTEDGKPSAHFEHTIALTEQGPIILTERS